jgi:hypothetical protein
VELSAGRYSARPFKLDGCCGGLGDPHAAGPNDMALYVRFFTRRKGVNFNSSKQTNSGKEA